VAKLGVVREDHSEDPYDVVKGKIVKNYDVAKELIFELYFGHY